MEINLNDLLAAKKETTTPAEKPATPAQEIEKVTTAVEQLTPEEQEKVAAIRDGIDLMNSQTSIQFGIQAQRNIAEFSDSILTNIRSKDSGYVGDLLSSLVVKVKGFDATDDDSFIKKIPLLGSLVTSAQNKLAEYEKVSVQVDKIQSELDKARTAMLKDIVMFDTLYQKNLEYFKTLQLYIVAGEEKLQELQTVTIPKLRAHLREALRLRLRQRLPRRARRARAAQQEDPRRRARRGLQAVHRGARRGRPRPREGCLRHRALPGVLLRQRHERRGRRQGQGDPGPVGKARLAMPARSAPRREQWLCMQSAPSPSHLWGRGAICLTVIFAPEIGVRGG